jgi:hypothetical protein
VCSEYFGLQRNRIARSRFCSKGQRAGGEGDNLQMPRPFGRFYRVVDVFFQAIVSGSIASTAFRDRPFVFNISMERYREPLVDGFLLPVQRDRPEFSG